LISCGYLVPAVPTTVASYSHDDEISCREPKMGIPWRMREEFSRHLEGDVRHIEGDVRL
jgi:hypothetical protein